MGKLIEWCTWKGGGMAGSRTWEGRGFSGKERERVGEANRGRIRASDVQV